MTAHILLKNSCLLRKLISICVTNGAILKGLGEQTRCKEKCLVGLAGSNVITLLVVGTLYDLVHLRARGGL